MSYYDEKQQLKDREIIANENNPFKLFLMHEKENFKQLTLEDWKKILPVISGLSNATKLAAYQAIQIKLEKKPLSSLVEISDEEIVNKFIKSIPTEKLIFWLNSEEKTTALIQNKNILTSILKRLPSDQHQAKDFYSSLIKRLPNLVDNVTNDVSHMADNLTTDRLDKFMVMLIDSGTIKSIISNIYDFHHIFSYGYSDQIKDKIYTECQDQLDIIMKKINEGTDLVYLFSAIPENRLMEFFRQYQSQIIDILKNDQDFNKESMLEAIPNHLLAKFCKMFEIPFKAPTPPLEPVPPPTPCQGNIGGFRDLHAAIDKLKSYAEIVSKLDKNKGDIAVTLSNRIKETLETFESIKNPSLEATSHFIKNFLERLHSQDKVMATQRFSAATVTKNFLIALTGVGLIALALKASHALVTGKGSCFFFAKNKTTRQEKIEVIETHLNTAIPLQALHT